jgi:hypothetical protein
LCGERHVALAMSSADTAHEERVGDERAVAAPGHGFGAHQGDALLLGQLDDFLDCLCESRRLHVIGVAAKGGVRQPAFGESGRARRRPPSAGSCV